MFFLAQFLLQVSILSFLSFSETRACPRGFKTFQTKCYKLVTKKVSYGEVAGACMALHNSWPAGVKDYAKAKELINVLNGQDRAWVGVEKFHDKWHLHTGEFLEAQASVWSLPHSKQSVSHAYMTERGLSDRNIRSTNRLPFICELGTST